MRNLERGNSHIETVVIISLVVIGVIVAFQILGKNINTTISKSNDQVAGYNPFGVKQNQNNSPVSTPQQTSKTQAQVTVSCTSTNCTVSINSTEFKNIPTDISGSIATSGASGATSVVSNLLDQIADIVESTIQDPATINAYREMANKGYALASLEEQMFDIAKQCGGYSDCLDPIIRIPGLPLITKDGQTYKVPTKAEDKIIQDAANAMTYFHDILSIYQNSIQTSTTVDETTKQLTESLLIEMKNLTQGFSNGYDAVMDTENSSWATADGPGTMNDLAKYPVETNITSLMICAVSDGTAANMPCGN